MPSKRRPCPKCGCQLQVTAASNGNGVVYIQTFCSRSNKGCGYRSQKLPVTAAALELTQRGAPVRDIMAAL